MYLLTSSLLSAYNFLVAKISFNQTILKCPKVFWNKYLILCLFFFPPLNSCFILRNRFYYSDRLAKIQESASFQKNNRKITWPSCGVVVFLTTLKWTTRMTTSFKQIIWNYIKQLLINSWQQRRPFWSRQQRDLSSMLPQWCYEEHIVLLYTNTQCTPHCACCQTLFFQITLYSVRDPGSPNPARQMQNSLVEAALTGAISADSSNQRDSATSYGVVVNRVWICPVAHGGTGY